MPDRTRHSASDRPLLSAVLAAALALAAGGCEDDSSPTDPPPPGGGGVMIRAASGNFVPLAGTWQSRCFTAPAGSPIASLRETFVIDDDSIVIELSGFPSSGCSGLEVSQEFVVTYVLGAETTARLGGAQVPVTRITGTVEATGESFLQVFHVDDTAVHRLFHGDLDDPPVDADGYPTALFEESLERR